MLSVDKINRLENDNSLLIGLITEVRELLIEGYNDEMPYASIDKAIKLIGEVEKQWIKQTK